MDSREHMLFLNHVVAEAMVEFAVDLFDVAMTDEHSTPEIEERCAIINAKWRKLFAPLVHRKPNERLLEELRARP